MALPKSDYTKMVRAFIDRLRTDPILKREVKVWRVWDGPGSAAPFSENQGIWVRISPSPKETATASFCEISHVCEMVIETYVPGENMDATLDLWARIESVANQIKDIPGIVNIGPTQAGYGAPNEEGTGFFGEGVIELQMMIPRGN